MNLFGGPRVDRSETTTSTTTTTTTSRSEPAPTASPTPKPEPQPVAITSSTVTTTTSSASTTEAQTTTPTSDTGPDEEPGFFARIGNSLSSAWTTVSTFAKDLVSEPIKTITTALSDFGSWAVDTIKAGWDALPSIGGLLSGIGDAIGSFFSGDTETAEKTTPKTDFSGSFDDYASTGSGIATSYLPPRHAQLYKQAGGFYALYLELLAEEVQSATPKARDGINNMVTDLGSEEALAKQREMEREVRSLITTMWVPPGVSREEVARKVLEVAKNPYLNDSTIAQIANGLPIIDTPEVRQAITTSGASNQSAFDIGAASFSWDRSRLN